MLPISVKDLLPQQFPFQQTDWLTSAEEKRYTSSFTIRPDNVLLSDHRFSAGGLVENMAQTAAAGTGYYYTSRNLSVPVGYIGAVKHLRIVRLPGTGEEIQTTVNVINQIGQASIAAAEVRSGEEILAQCELTIFLTS